jgi:transposase
MDQQLFEHEPVEVEADAVRPPRGGKRFMEMPGRDQMSLQVRCMEDFVPECAPVRIFEKLMSALDYSAFEQHYRGGGRPAWPPMLMVSILVWAYSQGIRSAREISRRLESDLNLMWLAHEQKIAHQRLSEFRRQFTDELAELFVQTVQLAKKLEVAEGLGLVAIDGSKVRANASRRVVDDEALLEKIKHLLAEAEQIDAAEDEEHGQARGDELPESAQDLRELAQRLNEIREQLEQSGQKHISTTDPEAPVQKTSEGLRPGYNVQAAVDQDSGLIVAQDVTDAQSDDSQFGPMLEQTIENTGEKPEAAVADTGYQSGDSLKAAEELEVESYIAQQEPTDEDRIAQDEFDYDEERDEFICPWGKRLIYRRDKTNPDGILQRLYATAHADCRGCPYRDRCLSPKGKRRELYVLEHFRLLREMRRRLATEEGKEAMGLRGQVVEPVFGTIKAVLGLREFLLRGLEGARAEFSLATTAFNMTKLVRAAL